MPLIGAQGPGSNISWRGNLDEYPDSYTFTAVTGVLAGTGATSPPTTITGINYKALVTAVGSGVSVRVTPYIEETDSYGPVGPFLPGNDENNLVIIRNKDKIELQVITADPTVVGRAAYNATYNANVAIGKREAEGWFARTEPIDDDPNPFDFIDLSDLATDTLTVSDTVTVTGIDDIIGVDIFIVGTGQLRINGTGSWVQSAKIFDGDTLQLRNTTSNFYFTSRVTTVQIGTFQANWSIETETADITIDDFTFTDIVDIDVEVTNESNSITISGADDNVGGNNPLSLTFSGNGEYKILQGLTIVQDYTNQSSNTCSNGDTIQLRQTSSSNYNTTTNATLTVSNQSDTYSVTTRPRPIDTVPDQFTFTDVNQVLRNELITSNVITLSGMTAFGDEGTATITSGSGVDGKFKVTRDGVVVHDWSNSSFGVQLGDQIQLRLLSATSSGGTRSATFTIAGQNTFVDLNGINGSTSDTWNVTSKARDCGVSSFSLSDIPESSSTLEPGDLAKTSFIIGGSFEFDCNITAVTSNSNSYLKNVRNSEQGSNISNLLVGDEIEVYMTTPYYCETRTTTVSLSAAFATSGSTQNADWTISAESPPLPILNLTADPIDPAFVIPIGGTTTIQYEYTHVTNTTVTATGPGGFDGLTSIPVTDFGNQTRTGSVVVTGLQNGNNTFELTVSNCTGSTTQSVNVIVGTPPAPTLNFCTTNPPTGSCSSLINIGSGNQITLYWSSTNAIRVEAIRGSGFNTGNSQSGSDPVKPISDGEVYTARAIGAGLNPDTVDKSITFNFIPSVTITASPTSIITGESVDVTWVSTDADSVVSSSGFNFGGITALNDSEVITPTSGGSYTWSITVQDTNGNTFSGQTDPPVVVTDDTSVDSFSMDPDNEDNIDLGERRESQPRFDDSPTNSVHGLSPGVSVTATISGGGATFLDGTTSKTVQNTTPCSSLRIKMNASNSYRTRKTCTMNIGGQQRTFRVRTKACVVTTGTYNIDGCSFNTKGFISDNGYSYDGIISFAGGCNGTTGGPRDTSNSTTVTRTSGQSSITLPAGTVSCQATSVGGGGGGGGTYPPAYYSGGITGAGGGGGGGFKVDIPLPLEGTTLTFRPGSGGVGNPGGSNPGTGGDGQYSSISKGSLTYYAKGGKGGRTTTNGAGAGDGGSYDISGTPATSVTYTTASLYRYVNNTTGDHFTGLSASPPSGYTSEGELCQVFVGTQPPGTVPVRDEEPGKPQSTYTAYAFPRDNPASTQFSILGTNINTNLIIARTNGSDVLWTDQYNEGSPSYVNDTTHHPQGYAFFAPSLTGYSITIQTSGIEGDGIGVNGTPGAYGNIGGGSGGGSANPVISTQSQQYTCPNGNSGYTGSTGGQGGSGSNSAGSCTYGIGQNNGNGGDGANYGGGGGGGADSGNKSGGDGGDGYVSVTYVVEYNRYNKVDVFKYISQAFWDSKNRPVDGPSMSYWYNQFKNNPATYPRIINLYNAIVSSLSGSTATNPTDNCGGTYTIFR